MVASQDRPLTLLEIMDLRMHVIMCQGCRQFHQNNTTLTKIMADYKNQP